MISYLDTAIGVWLAENNRSRISKPGQRQIAHSALLISPMVLLEFEVLYEIKRISMSPRDILRKLEFELGDTVCQLDFRAIAEVAIDEAWTHDPFDRIIVAHAKANGLAPLVTSDEHIQKHYPRAIW